jgi:hypothetical protein
MTFSDESYPKIIQYYYPSKKLGFQILVSTKYKFAGIKRTVNLYKFEVEGYIDQNK